MVPAKRDYKDLVFPHAPTASDCQGQEGKEQGFSLIRHDRDKIFACGSQPN